jgi:hypothetical protein
MRSCTVTVASALTPALRLASHFGTSAAITTELAVSSDNAASFLVSQGDRAFIVPGTTASLRGLGRGGVTWGERVHRHDQRGDRPVPIPAYNKLGGAHGARGRQRRPQRVLRPHRAGRRAGHGFRPTASPVEWLAAASILLLFVVAMSWLCALLGLLTDRPIGNHAVLAVAWFGAIGLASAGPATAIFRRRTAR